MGGSKNFSNMTWAAWTWGEEVSISKKQKEGQKGVVQGWME